MPSSDDDRIGARIAMYRKRASLTQHGLAQRIPYSYSMLHQVENGHKAASPQLVTAVARALHVDVSALTGPPTHSLLPDRVAAVIRPVREALDLYDLPTDSHIPTAPASELVTAADALCRDVRAARLHQAAATLPSILADLTATCREGGGTESWRALASAYRSAHDIARKLDRDDLARLALDRMGWAADHASDPVLAAIRQYMRALLYRAHEADHSIGLRLVADGHSLLEQADAGRDQQAVVGQLHLGAAVLAARAEDRTRAVGHLSEAMEMAKKTGEAGRVHWLSFGPANVGAHETYVRLELRQFDKAYTVARTVRPPRGWAKSRQAAHLVDRARAEMETGRTERALGTLVEAREMAPQQTRFHPRVRETVRALLHLRRQSPDSLSRMASWVGA